MRKEDTPSFLHDFLIVRTAPLRETFEAWAHAIGFHAKRYRPCLDHFSYKCREVREYDELRRRFEEHSDDGWRASRFIHESIISGRRVAVIGLTAGISTAFGLLRVLELSEPKPMSPAAAGFDHVEVYPSDGDAAAMASDLNRCGVGPRFVEKGRAHHPTWDALVPSGGRQGCQDLIVRLTDEPLVAKIGREMR